MPLRRDLDPTLDPHGLDVLPESRRVAFLWRFARHGTRAQVESYMAALTVRSCGVNPYKAPWFDTAVPGDDGLHHLWHPDRGMVCGNPGMSAPQGPWVHKEVFRWKDNNRLRQRVFSTLVRRTGEPVEPSLVRPGDRCWLVYSNDPDWRPVWPLWMGSEAPYCYRRGHAPRMLFRTRPGWYHDRDLVAFVDGVHRVLDAPVILVWDNLSAHRSRRIRAAVQAREWLEVEYLPSYAPELNPVEDVWSHVKGTGLANLAALSFAELSEAVRSGLRRLRYRPDLLDGFLAHTGLQLGTE